MPYYISKTVDLSFEDALIKVTENLKSEGFGILTEIDVKATLKKKLDVDFHNYKILGACNPPLAYKALQTDDQIGNLLPCNVVVQEDKQNNVVVSAIDPQTMLSISSNENIKSVADEASEKLKSAIESL